jgi:hypothetical protein
MEGETKVQTTAGYLVEMVGFKKRLLLYSVSVLEIKSPFWVWLSVSLFSLPHVLLRDPEWVSFSGCKPSVSIISKIQYKNLHSGPQKSFMVLLYLPLSLCSYHFPSWSIHTAIMVFSYSCILVLCSAIRPLHGLFLLSGEPFPPRQRHYLVHLSYQFTCQSFEEAFPDFQYSLILIYFIFQH